VYPSPHTSLGSQIPSPMFAQSCLFSPRDESNDVGI
jgi:hypothetical protein